MSSTLKNTFVTGDTGRVIERQFVDASGSIVIITGAQHVKVRWKQSGQTMVERDMSIFDGNNGIARYQQQAADFVAGRIEFEFEVKTGAGEIIKNPDLDGPYFVREKF